MKKYLILPVIALVAMFGFSGTASAGTCATNSSGIVYKGTTLQQQFNAYGCSDVDMVEWTTYVPAFGWEGFADLSNNTVHAVVSPPTVADVKCGRQYTTYTDTCSHTLHVNPWCPPQTPHTVYGAALGRVHTKSTQTWSSWFGVWSSNYTIWC